MNNCDDLHLDLVNIKNEKFRLLQGTGNGEDERMDVSETEENNNVAFANDYFTLEHFEQGLFGLDSPLKGIREVPSARKLPSSVRQHVRSDDPNTTSFVVGNDNGTTLNESWLNGFNKFNDSTKQHEEKKHVEDNAVTKIQMQNGTPSASVLGIKSNNVITDTPMITVTPRRSLRTKRKIYESLDPQKIVKFIRSQQNTPIPSQRQSNIEASSGYVKPGQTSHLNDVSKPPSIEDNQSVVSFEDEDTEDDLKLKIVFRRSQPPNKIDRKMIKFMDFRRGLLDPRKELAASRLLVHSSFTFPPTKSNVDVDVKKKIVKSITTDLPLDPDRIKNLQKIQWMENYNLVGVARAHGAEKLGKMSKALTPDGNAVQIRGKLSTFNLNNIYDDLLDYQNSLKIVQDFKSKTETRKEAEKISDLNTTFQNLTCFEGLFGEGQTSTSSKKDKPYNPFASMTRITGAVKVDPKKLERSKVLKGGRLVFPHCGEMYRLNPVAVVLDKTPDELIELVRDKPRKITEDSLYYNTLTSLSSKLVLSSQESSGSQDCSSSQTVFSSQSSFKSQ